MICAPGRRHHRRPDRLPPRPRSGSSSSPTPATRGRRRDALAERLERLQGRPRRPVARDRRSSRSRVRGRAEILAPLTDVDLDGAALLRDRRGHGGRHPGPRRPDRLHRRGRLRGLRRRRPGRRAVGRAAGRRARRRAGPGRARRPRHAPARGRDAALRQRARPRRRTRSRPASAGSSSSTSPATSSAGRRSSGSPRDGAARRLVGLVDARAAGSPATATRSAPATRRDRAS